MYVHVFAFANTRAYTLSLFLFRNEATQDHEGNKVQSREYEDEVREGVT